MSLQVCSKLCMEKEVETRMHFLDDSDMFCDQNLVRFIFSHNSHIFIWFSLFLHVYYLLF
jgi:hypothetical protein